jgi:hypothetical protein
MENNCEKKSKSRIVKSENAKTENAKTENAKTENAKTENAKTENAKTENAKTEKINVKLNKSIIDENSKGESKKVKNKDKNIKFIIVEKNGSLKDADIKEGLICEEELSKKCKFKKSDGFIKRTEWSYSSKNEEENSISKVIVELWAKDDGVANHENKYEFPPPVDTELFFGACALIARDTKNNYVNLTKDKWNKIYEYLFGGFESLVANEDDDDDEEDELESVPKNRKTRDGYLKDGFVVDGGAGCDSDVDVAGNAEENGSDDDDDDDDDDDSDTDSDKSSENGSNDGEVDGDVDGVYFKKNRNILTKGKLIKTKPKNKNSIVDSDKHALKDEDDDNSGWKTDESSELSEEEYSYSR